MGKRQNLLIEMILLFKANLGCKSYIFENINILTASE